MGKLGGLATTAFMRVPLDYGVWGVLDNIPVYKDQIKPILTNLHVVL